MKYDYKAIHPLGSSGKEIFLQSEEWCKFQESAGKKTLLFESESFRASVMEHILPIVGKYFYVPRGPILKISNSKLQNPSKDKQDLQNSFYKLVDLAKKENVGWIRIEPQDENDLKKIKESIKERIVKAPHDMQPKEILVLDIAKSEEQLLSEMKPKTRYNIRLAEKKNVVISQWSSVIDKKKYIEEFLRLNRETAQRDGIVTHSDDYYRKMIEILPEEMISIYLAEYEGPASTRGDDRSSTRLGSARLARGGKILAANLVIFFEDAATYAHGASSNESREVMAPYILQWKQIQDAKIKGCKEYDFGGVKAVKRSDLTPILSSGRRGSKGEVDSWEGITRFKTGFSTKTESVVFPGCYDIIINPRKYSIYKGLQKANNFLRKIRR